ncbi:hypothetical protein MM221_04495 [Salipaludibacillus sp. LMS25]|uniref:hypothetical protein n=1 Tax=Salipaludibacillus sp. LMS25 TaxID=2924031 RepID=UPI0020D158DA|nr:hypothetical protein [Salipaludibacillus sp. LMS25]UTR15827.1 hypothetical protein MM221_04495 [Salipaludibacillus sp. LMS25]
MATALPIGEYKHHAKMYHQKYLNEGQPHIVTFHSTINQWKKTIPPLIEGTLYNLE